MGAESAGAYLTHVLTEPGAARDRWQRRSARADGRLSPAAVAQVMTAWLWESGERAETDTALARQLKDRVGRAIAGRNLSEETLRWFVEAFAIGPEDERRLRALLQDAPSVRVVRGGAVVPDVPSSQPHRTLSLHEHHYLGPDGSPSEHRTTQVLEAVEDGLDTHLYLFDTSAVSIEVLQGGEPDGPVRLVRPGLFALQIRLTRPLEQGETTTLQYTSRFRYATRPDPVFRRAARMRVESVDLRLQFDERRLPTGLRYAEWHDLDGPPTTTRAVELEADLSTHVFLRSVEGIVGFEWDFADGTRTA